MLILTFCLKTCFKKPENYRLKRLYQWHSSIQNTINQAYEYMSELFFNKSTNNFKWVNR